MARLWTIEEENKLFHLLRNKYKLVDISKILNRSNTAIILRIQKYIYEHKNTIGINSISKLTGFDSHKINKYYDQFKNRLNYNKCVKNSNTPNISRTSGTSGTSGTSRTSRTSRIIKNITQPQYKKQTKEKIKATSRNKKIKKINKIKNTDEYTNILLRNIITTIK